MGKINRERRRQKLAQKEALKKRKREKAMKNQKSKSIAPALQIFPNPFEGLSDEQRRLAIAEIAKKSEEQYQAALADLKELFKQYDAQLLLSFVSTYGLNMSVSETTGVTKGDSDFEIYQLHVEILQALSLQVKPDEMGVAPFGPDVSQRVWEKIKQLADSLHFRQLNPAGADLPDDEKTITLVQQLMRGATQAVRNWGFHSQVKRIARELYSPFDARLAEARGYSVSNLIDVFEAILQKVEARLTTRHETLANLFREAGKNKTLLVEKYHELIGQDKADAEKFIEHFVVEKAPLDGVRSMILSHYDLRLREIYSFSPKDLGEQLGLEENVVRAILDDYSLEWGALTEYETEYIYLSNPIWTRPLIKTDHEEYFCTIPVCFFSFVLPATETYLEPLEPQVSDRRAKYLESKAADILGRRFPASDIKRNVKWMLDGATYETDLIAFIDSFALVIECKSGKITPPALRGAPDRLRRHIQDLLIDPNQQSLRLKKRLEHLSQNPKVADPLREELGYDLSKVRKVVRVSICLEDFGAIQSSLNQLKDSGWLPKDFLPCPTMNLADFETIFDILEHPVQILHYLMRREAIEATVEYLADELDLVGLYLSTLLNIGDVAPDTSITMTGMSTPLDKYYNSLDAGVTLNKPQPEITPLFASIFAQLEQRGIERWTEMGVALNMFSPDDQTKIGKMLAKLEKGVAKNWETEGHENMVICIPPKASTYALGYVMFKNENAGRRREFMEHAAGTAFESDHVETVIVIGKNIDRADASYHAIALFEAPPELAD